ncbi:MAG: tRNA-specific adenosine deaminase [Deltaproteobacteria bacterium]|nr:MAG: tRNA-specific adenosine deaminase [Deltaproteobacteria bacterium]
MTPEQQQQWMREALQEAHRAFAEQEVPVGAVVVCDGRVVGRGRNRKEALRDPTAHAEVLALRQAAHHLDRWRLSGCSLVVTLEPCPMCMGAMISARIERLVFACPDPKSGAARSLYQLGQDERFNHRFEVVGGVLAEPAAELLRRFFRQRR